MSGTSELGTKFNPFRPNSIVGPGMFAGRLRELQCLGRALFQTANGNPEHFLITGNRGIMNLAVFGNIVTSFSWFGVNMLGIGLHSYGFMDAAFKWLMIFIGSQVFIIAVGFLPFSMWRSFRTADKTPPAALPAPASAT
jgi:hypothetical protein